MYTPGQFNNRAVAQDRVDQMREAYSKGNRCKGFTITITAGTSSYNVDLSGMAKHFLGIGFFFTTTPGAAVTTQLVINNDVVIDSAIINHFRVDGASEPRDYYAFPRPLNGQDTITFNFNNTTGGSITAYLNVYYI
jgi:hypothetical protein